MEKFQNKKVLQIGLDHLGRRLAIAKYLMKQGACLTICDLKSKAELCQTLKRLKRYNKCFKFISERNPSEKEIQENDIIVLNHDIPYAGNLLKMAKRFNKQIETDYTIFTDSLKGGRAERYIGVTGTSGKTAIITFLTLLLDRKAVSEVNISNTDKPFLNITNRKINLFIAELSSSDLEYVTINTLPPHIAIVSNLHSGYTDSYPLIKDLNAMANIFRFQKDSDYLILNKDNLYLAGFLKKKPKAQVYYLSLKKLPSEDSGLYLDRSRVYFQESGKRQFIYKFPFDNIDNLKNIFMTALLGAYLYTHDWGAIIKMANDLPNKLFISSLIKRSPKNIYVCKRWVRHSVT